MAWRKNDPSFTQDAGEYAKQQGDFAKAQAELASQKAADADTAAASAKYEWKGTLTDDDALAAVTGMEEGWVFRIKNSASNDNLSRTVRYDGTQWVTTDLQDPTAINTISQQLDDLEGQFDAAVGAVTVDSEVVLARQSTVKGKTFTTLDGRLEELEGDTYMSMTNEGQKYSWGLTNATQNALVGEEITFTATASGGYASRFILRTSGNKYYIALSVKSPTDQVAVTINAGAADFSASKHTGGNQYERLSAIHIAPDSTSATIRIRDNRTSGFTAISVKNVSYINLTAHFGAGNEPSKEEMDRLLAKYPNSFFDGTVNLTPKLLDDLRYLTSDVQMPMRNMVVNGDMSQGTTSWIKNISAMSVTSESGKLKLYHLNEGATIYPNINQTLPLNIKSGNKYYLTFSISDYASTNAGITLQWGSQILVNTINSNGNKKYIFTATQSTSMLYFNHTVATGQKIDYALDDVILIDLTETFGAGNEPTQAQMDALLATYPNSWFDGTVNLAENKRIIPFLLKRLELKADKAQGAWISPTLLNGWVQASSNYDSVTYMKDSMGFVHLRGMVQYGSSGNIFTLPAGYRPDKFAFFSTGTNISATGTTSALYIDGIGNVYTYNNVGSRIFLDGIIFKAEK